MNFLQLLFWIVWFLCLIGLFTPISPATNRPVGVIVLVLTGILGLLVIGNPIHK